MGITMITGGTDRLIGKPNTAVTVSLGTNNTNSRIDSTNSYTTPWTMINASTSQEFVLTHGSLWTSQPLTTSATPAWADMFAVDIGIGASGSETVIATALVSWQSNDGTNQANLCGRFDFPVSPRIAAGNRVSMRTKRIQGTAYRDINVGFFYNLYGTPLAALEGE